MVPSMDVKDNDFIDETRGLVLPFICFHLVCANSSSPGGCELCFFAHIYSLFIYNFSMISYLMLNPTILFNMPRYASKHIMGLIATLSAR